MFFQFLTAEKGGAVEPLQLLARRVALPVRAGDRKQLERSDSPGRRHMRAAAEVDEFALPIERNGRFVGQAAFEVFDFERLAQIAAKLNGLLAIHLDPLERLVFGDDFGHFRLDFREIGLGERVFHLKIVIKPVGNRRAKRQLHTVKQPHDRPSHEMGTGMPQKLDSFGIFIGDQPQRDLAVGRQRIMNADQLAVDFGGESSFSEPSADIGGNVDRANAARVFQNLSVRQSNF